MSMKENYKCGMPDAYALSLLGQIPRELRERMYYDYIIHMDISDATKNLIETELEKIK